MNYQLIVLRGRSASKAVKLVEGITTVGRQDDCQLKIASAQVSRKHCQLFEHKGHLLVKDLGSANGTFVNGQKIAPQRVLEPGDELAIGPIRFRVEKLAGAPAATPAARPAVSASDTAVGPAAASAEPILGDPILAIADMDTVGESNDFEVIVDESPEQLGDDDTISVDMDDETPTPEPAARPAPAPTPTPTPQKAKSDDDKDLGEDAVADFLLSLKTEDE